MMFTMLGCWQSGFLGRELLAGSPANLWGRSSGVLAGYLWLTPGPTTGQPARGGSVETKRAGCPQPGNRAGNDGGPGATNSEAATKGRSDVC